MSPELQAILKVIEVVIEVVGAAFLGLIIWGMKKLVIVVVDNNYATIRLTSQMEDLTKAVEPIPKMQNDLHHAHAKIRELEKRTEGL